MRFGSLQLGWGWQTIARASAPAVWGKLPSHGDFIQHGIKAGEVQAWQHWLAEHVRPKVEPKPTVVPRFRAGEHWLSLDAPQRQKPLAQRVPVAFVLPPGTLTFARQHVAGVMANSHDRLGREHPIIVYQCVNRRWLEQHVVGDASQEPAAALRQWLFALTRLLDRYVQPPDEEGAKSLGPNAPRTTTTLALSQAIDRLWALYVPGWPQRLGMAERMPSLSEVQAVLQQAPTQSGPAPAESLQGMPRLPWVDWPERLWTKPCAAFWQQDGQGGYVGSSLRLGEIWNR